MEVDNITMSKKKMKKQKKSLMMASEGNATPDMGSTSCKRKFGQQTSLDGSNFTEMDTSIPKKKRKKNKSLSVDSSIDNVGDSDGKANLGETNESSDLEDSVNETMNATSATNVSGLSLASNESPKKKKKNRKKKNQSGIANTPDQNESTNNEEQLDTLDTTGNVSDISSEKKKKNRKKKKLQQTNVLNQSNNTTSNEHDESFDVKTSPVKGLQKKKRKISQGDDTTETDHFANEESTSNQLEDSDDMDQDAIVDEPKKKKKKLVTGKSIQVDNEAEAKSPMLSKKETKLLKKKNKKLQSIVPGLNSDPELTKFSLKSEDTDEDEDDEENDSNDDAEEDSGESDAAESDDADDKSSFPRMPNKKFVPKEEDSEEKLGRTLFVGNLPISVDEKILKDLFKGIGKVESVRLRCAVPPKPSMSQKVANIKHEYHKDTTSLKGFVVFEEQEDAEKALSMNGTVFNGNHIRVDKAFGKKPQNVNSPFNDKAKTYDNSTSLFLGNLSYNVDDETMWNTFSSCGTVKSVRLIRDQQTGAGKGFGFIEFEDASSLEPALALDGTEVNGRQMRVQPAANKSRNDSGPRRFQNQQNRNSGGPPHNRFGGFRKFKGNDRQDFDPRKNPKKMENQWKMDREKKKIAAIFKAD